MSTQEKMITIKPAKAGVNVLKPNGEHLAADGETVQRTSYWVRRLSDGDIAIVQQAKTAAKKGE